MRHRLLSLFAVCLIVIGLLPPSAIQAGAPPLQDGDHYVYLPAVLNPPLFQESFTGSPPSPTPWRAGNWEVAVHSRDIATWDKLEPMQAEHGSDCGPPPATHPVTAYEDAVFQCRDHVMTAINASGYGAVYLTPDHMVDFSSGEAVIRFDMSTLRKSGRDWIELWINPYEDNLQLPGRDWLPDLNGEPRRGIFVVMGFSKDNTTFEAGVVRDFQAQKVKSSPYGYETFLTPSAMRRDTFELRISRTRIRFGMPGYKYWWVNAAIPTLDWTQGIVQFGHHSYTPTKDCAGGGCGPNTWHWDNVSIYPAAPFSIEQLEPRYVNTTRRIDLPAPAGPNAHLRFTGIGNNLRVSFDLGQTWLPAARQAQERLVDEVFKSYWMPIPPGTSVIRFRGDDWWGGEWRVKDISIWSK